MTKRVRLREELNRQRAALLTDWNLSPAPLSERALYADPIDQASSDLEQDLAIRVRTRIIGRLKRIERALRLVQTKNYGWCRRSMEGGHAMRAPCRHAGIRDYI